MPEVEPIPGGVHRDIRDEMRHVNPFNFKRVDCLNTVHPARPCELRGWVGQRHEWKWFVVGKGSIEVGGVEPGNWTEPDRGAAVRRFHLDPDTPVVVEVSPGFYTATAARTAGARVWSFPREISRMLTPMTSGCRHISGSSESWDSDR